MHKRSWVEVDLAQVVQNYRAYAACLAAGSRIMAVVKADAYGHGDVAVAQALAQEGVSLFAVACIDEAIALRRAGIAGEILILGYTPTTALPLCREYDITQSLVSEDYAEAFADAAPAGVKCQFKLDTGMSRIGLPANDPDACEACIRRYAKRLSLTGIFTHLCVADSNQEEDIAFTQTQIARFEALCDRVRDLSLPYLHCMNSAGGVHTNSKYDKIVRLGILLYGLQPSPDIPLPEGVRPALTWKSVVSAMHTIKDGESVGYGRTYRADGTRRIATIPTGYADGYSRLLSNKGRVFIHGKPAPIVGRVCMDQMMVDVTSIPECALYDEVTLIGDSYTADNMASELGTIGYEIVCDIGKRVHRIYKNDNNCLHNKG